MNFFKETAASRGDGSEAAGQDSEQEARRFHNHYEANGWRVGQNQMQNWRAAAENWLLKAPAFNAREKQAGRGGPSSSHYLNANQYKDYDEPL